MDDLESQKLLDQKFSLSVTKLLLSAESISENSLILSSVTPTFTRYLSDVKSRTLNGFRGVEKISSYLLKLDLFSSSKKKEFDRLSFIDISTMLVAIPEGFNGSMLEYSTIMKTLYYDMTRTCTEFLNVVNMELGRIVNNRSSKISSSDLESIYLPYQKLRLDAAEITQKFFEKHSTKSRETLGNIFNGKTEVSETFENGDAIERYIGSTDIRGILNLVDDTSYLLTEIEKQIKIDSSTKFSPQVIQFLGNGVKEAALYVEYLATLFYDTDVLLNILNEIHNALSRVAKHV